MLVVGSLTARVPFPLGIQVTKCPRNYHLNLFEKCPMIVIDGRGLRGGPGLNVLGNLQETASGN